MWGNKVFEVKPYWEQGTELKGGVAKIDNPHRGFKGL